MLVQQAKDFIFARQRAYYLTFGEGEHVKIVLDDLRKFCRDGESTFHEDPRKHALLEGRREVFLRIKDHLEMKSQDFWDKYGEGKKV